MTICAKKLEFEFYNTLAKILNLRPQKSKG